MTPVAILLHALCAVLLVWAWHSVRRARTRWNLSVPDPMQRRVIRVFLGRTVGRWEEEHASLLPWATGSRSIRTDHGWIECSGPAIASYLEELGPARLALALRAVDVAFQVCGSLRGEWVAELLSGDSVGRSLEIYLPVQGSRADPRTMEIVGQGFTVGRVLRPGFVHVSGEIYRRATVEATL